MSVRDDYYITKISEDDFGRGNLVRLIVDSIINRINQKQEKSLSFGIYGEWGEGKTSLMKMLETELSKIDKIKCVWFNPYSSYDSEHFYYDFFSVLSSFSFDSNLSNAIKSYCEELCLKESHRTPVVSSYMSQLRRSLPYDGYDISSLKKGISKHLNESGNYIVCFIDDLDRLLPEEIRTVFKLSRQLADFDNTIYIMGFDPNVVSKLLLKDLGSEELGRSFIDKMIQIPIKLPVLQSLLLEHHIEYYFKHIIYDYKIDIDINSEDFYSLKTDLSKILITKRSIIRYFNQLYLVLPSIHLEINFIELCYSESLKFLSEQGWYEIYLQKDNLLRNYKSIVEQALNDNKEIEKRFSDSVQIILQFYPEKWKSYVTNVLNMSLFPQNKKIGNRNVLKSINDNLYFNQYFICCVPYNLIPQEEILKFKRDYENELNYECVKTWIDDKKGKYVDSEILRSIIAVLEYSQTEITDSNTEYMAISMAKGIAFSILSDNYSFNTIQNPNPAASIIAYTIIPRFLGYYDKENYHVNTFMEGKLLKEIFDDAPINFCMVLFCFIYSNKGTKPDNGKDIIDTIKNRLLKNHLLKLFDYSYVIVKSFLETWNRIDPSAFDDYLIKVFRLKDFDFGKMINIWFDDSDNSKLEMQSLISLLLPLKQLIYDKLKKSIYKESALVNQFLHIFDNATK